MKKKIISLISIIMLVTISMISLSIVSADNPTASVTIGSISIGGGQNSYAIASAQLSKNVTIVPGTEVTFYLPYSFSNLSGSQYDMAWAHCSYIGGWSEADEDESDTMEYSDVFNPNDSIQFTIIARYYDNWSSSIKNQDIKTITVHFVFPENDPPSVGTPTGNTQVVLSWPWYTATETYSSTISDPNGNNMHYSFNLANPGTGNGYSHNGSVNTTKTFNTADNYTLYCHVYDFPKYEGQPSENATSEDLLITVSNPESDSNAYSSATEMSIVQGAAQAFKTDPLPIDFDTDNANVYGFFSDERNNDSIYDNFHCKELDDQNMTVDVSDSFYVCYSESLDMYFIDADYDHIFDATIDANSLENCTFGENPWEEQSKE